MLPLVDELPVDLIGDEEQIVPQGELSEELKLVFPVYHPGRIARVGEQDRPRSWTDQALYLLPGREMKTILLGCGDGHKLHLGQARKPVIVGIKGLGHQHLITRVADHLEGKQHRLRAPGGDDELIRGKLDAPLRVVSSEGLDGFRKPLGGRVGEDLNVRSPDALQVLLWGRDIWLADVKVIDLFPPALCLLSEGVKAADRGGRGSGAAS